MSVGGTVVVSEVSDGSVVGSVGEAGGVGTVDPVWTGVLTGTEGGLKVTTESVSLGEDSGATITVVLAPPQEEKMPRQKTRHSRKEIVFFIG